MTIKIEKSTAKHIKQGKQRSGVGFTNLLALLIMAFLSVGLVGGFYLALKSIEYQYMGALACYTAVFAPIGTAASIVLKGIVHKSEVENSGADGEGIKYAAAKASNFMDTDIDSNLEQSPQI